LKVSIDLYAVILLVMVHTLRGEHAQEEKGKGRKPKT
jgi:hypothetical protein